MKKEKKEALIRIPIAIIGILILELFGAFSLFLILIQLIIVLFTGSRNKDISKILNMYLTLLYKTTRYICFLTNERPFPFGDLGKPIEKPDHKFQN